MYHYQLRVFLGDFSEMIGNHVPVKQKTLVIYIRYTRVYHSRWYNLLIFNIGYSSLSDKKVKVKAVYSS